MAPRLAGGNSRIVEERAGRILCVACADRAGEYAGDEQSA
jgi:hypothetical protein